MSLVSRGSLERLREEAAVGRPVDGRRFRMTFEIDGVEPHAEDAWIGSSVRIGSAAIGVTGDVGRCLVTSHDPDTGVTDLDTLGTLAHYRRDGHTEPLPFGVYCRVTAPGRVSVGDAVIPWRTSTSGRTRALATSWRGTPAPRIRTVDRLVAHTGAPPADVSRDGRANRGRAGSRSGTSRRRTASR